MHIDWKICPHLTELAAAEWNRLNVTDCPFLRHEFLSALERHHCVGPHWGWFPRHLAGFNRDGELIAAMPLYLKNNSYGELVFDWAWADAYQRLGGSWYPKLVSAIPYTPASGQRLLTAPELDRETLMRATVDQAITYARQCQVSSLHVLFHTDDEARILADAGLLSRHDCQFHWHNPGWHDFDGFLLALRSRRRKEIRRERRTAQGHGLQFEWLAGDQAGTAHWQTLHTLYKRTFDEKGGYATLTLSFFLDVAAHMGDRVRLCLVQREQQTIAGALFFVGPDTLYGRHWGSHEDLSALHFETCYYQGIEQALGLGLKHFEPGAQGEYKLARGFLPTRTRSSHWLAQPDFRQIIDRFLTQERQHTQTYLDECGSHSPYKSTDIK